jgi:glycosyltransferase involved in cell wall biosynthesis
MINILHIINGWPVGGILEQTYLLCKYLPKDQFKQYSIGYCHFDGAFVKKFEQIGVQCIHSDANYVNLKEVIDTHKIDIVHRQTGGGDCPAYAYLLKELGVPLVETLHCPRASGIPVELLSALIYTTPYTFYKNSVKHMDKMVSIQYALDLERPIKDQADSTSKDCIVVGRLGRIVPDKRADILIELAAMAYKDYGDKIQFKVAGQIPQDYPVHIEHGKKFLQLVDTLPNFEYCGYVENKYDFWRTLDVCINPVQEASFDIVFLEAMACGVPILTWNNSAAKYVVGNAGLVTEENIHAIYEGLKKLYNDYKFRNLLGDIGINYIKGKYNLKNCIDGHIALYNQVIKNVK